MPTLCQTGPIEALEWREEAHGGRRGGQGGPAGVHELCEDLPGPAEAGAEVEEPAVLIPLEQDAVAADFAGGRRRTP